MALPRAALPILLSAALALAGCSGSPDDDAAGEGGAGGDAGGGGSGGPPLLRVGDHWRHETAGGGATVTTKMEVVAIEDHDGASAYRLEGTVETTAAGAATTAESTSWTRVTDHAAMESVSTAHISFGGQSYDSTTTTVHDPPCVTLRWDLSVGATWTSTCTSTTTSSSGSSQTTTTTTTFTVEAEERVTVEAGSFDTFRIRVDSEDQSHRQWVSGEACGMVKSEGTSQGQTVTTELVEYEC